LLATAPNQVWSWDISKLKGPAKWTYFYLYVVLDIFSRYALSASRRILTICSSVNLLLRIASLGRERREAT
jgi:transposase InsO family protein